MWICIYFMSYLPLMKLQKWTVYILIYYYVPNILHLLFVAGSQPIFHHISTYVNFYVNDNLYFYIHYVHCCDTHVVLKRPVLFTPEPTALLSISTTPDCYKMAPTLGQDGEKQHITTMDSFGLTEWVDGELFSEL